MKGQLFSIGELYITTNVLNEVPSDFILYSLYRHITGDWGDLCEEDKALNEEALKSGGRLLSKYTSKEGFSIYIITEWDRSRTTILFPEEY